MGLLLLLTAAMKRMTADFLPGFACTCGSHWMARANHGMQQRNQRPAGLHGSSGRLGATMLESFCHDLG